MDVTPGIGSTEFKALLATFLIAMADGTVPKELLEMDPGLLKLLILAGVVYGVSRTVVKIFALKYNSTETTNV